MSEAAARFTIEGIDEASDVVKKIGQIVEEAGGTMETVNKKSEVSTKNFALALNNVMTSCMSLYNAYDNVTNSQLALDKANIQVKTTTESLEAAQAKAAAAVAKYGADSDQAKQANDALAIAVDKANLAVDRQGQASENVTKSMLSGIMTVIPTCITLFSSLTTVTEENSAAQRLLNAVRLADPTMLVVAAIAALIAVLVVAYNTCEPFRNVVNAIGTALVNFFRPAIEGASKVVGILGDVWSKVVGGISWVYEHTLKPVIDGIIWFVNLIKGATSAINGATGAVNNANRAMGGGPGMGSRQSGGPISSTGPYLLHAGEFVIPAGAFGGGTVFEKGSIQITILDVLDDDLVSTISEEIALRIKRRGMR